MLRLCIAPVASVVASLVVGCATYPPTPGATVNAENINYAILTELYCAVTAPEFLIYKHKSGNPLSYFATQDNWVAAVDLFLSTSIEGSANPVVSLLGPFNTARAFPAGGSVGSFTSAFGATFDQTRTNLSEYKVIIFLPSFILGNDKASPPIESWPQFAQRAHWPVHCDDPNRGGTYLEGRLGLKEWLKPAVYTEQSTQQFAPPSTANGAAPSISDLVDPKSGKPKHSGTAGDNLTITGSNLTNGTVSFGASAPVLSLPKASGTAITVQVPPRGKPDPNTVGVIVTTPNGVSQSKSAQFTYVGNGGGDKKDANKDANVELLQTFQALQAQQLAIAAAQTGSQASGGAQSPTISSTITFMLKSTGTLGPSFTLARVSGGSSSLFTISRTDDNYVEIVLTPATYCWTRLQSQSGQQPTCPALPSSGIYPEMTALSRNRNKIAREQPQPADIQSAVERINNALLNLNLAHTLAP